MWAGPEATLGEVLSKHSQPLMMPLKALVLLRDGATNPEVPIPMVLGESGHAVVGPLPDSPVPLPPLPGGPTHTTTTPRLLALTSRTKISI